MGVERELGLESVPAFAGAVFECAERLFAQFVDSVVYSHLWLAFCLLPQVEHALLLICPYFEVFGHFDTLLEWEWDQLSIALFVAFSFSC